MNPSARTSLEQQHEVFTRRTAIAAGLTPDQIRWALSSRRWTALRRGHYVTTEHLLVLAHDVRAMHTLQARAALMHLGCAVVISHRSAAVLHGIVLHRPPAVVTVTTGRHERRTVLGVDVRTTRSPDLQSELIEGLPVTCAARTVIDVARTEPLADALVVMDAAVGSGLATREELESLLDEHSRWPGITAAREALRRCDPATGDPVRSWCRGHLIEQGLPAPECDVEVSASGVPLGRYGFVWPERRTLAAIDPVVGSPQEQLDEVRRRRRLDDRVRGLGYEVVSFAIDEIEEQPQLVAHRIRSAFGRAAHAA